MSIMFWAGAVIMVTAWAKAGQLVLQGKKLYESQQDKEKTEGIEQETLSPSKLHKNSPNRLVQLLPVSRKEAPKGVSDYEG